MVPLENLINPTPDEMKDLCNRLGAFETDRWAAREILEYELMTPNVLDPCCGTGILAYAAMEAGHHVTTIDIYDWSQHFKCPKPQDIGDFLELKEVKGGPFTVYMNPPFDKACEFIDKGMELGARKIISFQAWSWRGSDKRVEWWVENPPARIWICIDRATCMRFDVAHTCIEPEICATLPKKKGRAGAKCRECMGSTPTTHAFFVWEAGHKGAEIICNLRKPKPRKEP